jgi:hypothetical protein
MFDARDTLTCVRAARSSAARIALIDATVAIVVSKIACFGRWHCRNAGIFTAILRHPIDIEVSVFTCSNRAYARCATRFCVRGAANAPARSAVRNIGCEVEILVDVPVAIIVAPIATDIGGIGGDATILAAIFGISVEVDPAHVAGLDLACPIDADAERSKRCTARIASTAVFDRRARIDAFVDVPVAIIVALVTALETTGDTAIGLVSRIELARVASNEPAAVTASASITRCSVGLAAGQAIRIELTTGKRPKDCEDTERSSERGMAQCREVHRPPRSHRRPRRIETTAPSAMRRSMPNAARVLV